MTEPYDDPGGDPLAGLLTAARRDVDADAVRAESAALAREVARRPRRRTHHRGVAIGLAALVVAVPTSAAAYQWTTHTGLFGDPVANTEDVDSSEVLDLCAPDFPATARTLMPADLPLPDGATRQTAYHEVVRVLTRRCATEGDLMQATGVPAQAEGYAWCSWVNTYLADPPSRAEAAEALRHYANSDITHVVDDNGDMGRWENGIADAAERGDAEKVAYEQRVNCDAGRYGWRP